MRLFSGDSVKESCGIDIIIPVYNALSDLKVCVSSIVAHTDLGIHRVILVDDKSPDENVLPYLKSVEGNGIIVLANETNLGFSGTVNRGMSFSDRDVILLNSDTVVTAGWVEKLAACAYSDAAIATATPFSNNATLCSIPEFCAENKVPYGLSIDEYAGVIQRASMKKYPRITVAVGFCMFIKREVISAVGLFDAETFRRGYGEENDFCWRAQQLGFYHALCDDTYIYHSGSVSFLSEEKKKLIAEHEGIVASRYPCENQANAEHVRDDPNAYLRTNADIYARLSRGKKNILYLLHLDFRTGSANNIGGTQFHVKDLTEHFKAENNVFVLAREGDALRLTVYFGEEKLSFSFPVGSAPRFQSFHSGEIADALRQIITGFSIDIIHVHHVFGLSLDVFKIARELGVPCIATLHDLYYICPTVSLLKDGKAYCGGGAEDCRGCLSCQLGYARETNLLPFWRENCRSALKSCQELIAPSEAVRDIYREIYPELDIRVIPHGAGLASFGIEGFLPPSEGNFEYTLESAFKDGRRVSGWAFAAGCDSRDCEILLLASDGEAFRVYKTMPVCRGDVAAAAGDERYLFSGFDVQLPDRSFASGEIDLQIAVKWGDRVEASPVIKSRGYCRREKKKKRIAFLGGLNTAKGSKTAVEMLSRGSKYDWYIVGGIGDAELAAIERGNILKTDWYPRENAPAILRENEIDLVCVLSVVPETFCYTISEAQLAGVPILTLDLGAQGERVARDGTGWIMPRGANAEEILAKIDEIFSGEEYNRVLQRVKAFTHRTQGEMMADYAGLYSGMPSAERYLDFDREKIYRAYVMGGGGGTGADADLVRRITLLEGRLNSITKSMEYRMFSFFNRKSFPGKKLVKKFIFWGYKIYKRLK